MQKARCAEDGAGAAAPSAGEMDAPQLMQKRLPGFTGSPQAGQRP
jgi:hypothetical protein